MSEQTRERPILMSAPMVRAILDGSKMQTRRIVKMMPKSVVGYRRLIAHSAGLTEREKENLIRDGCPYGVAGDHLWVRETFAWEVAREIGSVGPIAFRAGCHRENNICPFRRAEYGVWKPSIHMPRYASRITLEVSSVRVERLQEISEEDARAEGVDWAGPQPYGEKWDEDDREDPGVVGYPRSDTSFALDNYRRLWESIHGPRSWDLNPWVWVIEFKCL